MRCDRFRSDVAVRLPADSATTVYGFLEGMLEKLKTRSGELPVQPSAIPAGLPGNVALASQLYVKASVRNGTVVRITPYVLVTGAAVLAPYLSQQASGRVEWVAPPEGVRPTQWTRIRFQGHITDDALAGRILNYRKSVQSGGRCHAPLRAGTQASAYARIFGPGSRVTATWFPAMHFAQDSEVNIQTSRGVNYMTPGPQQADLMVGPWQPTSVAWLIHGTPIGVPVHIPATLSPRTQARYC